MIEIVVKGRPVSYNNENPKRKQRWKEKVATEAKKVCSSPSNDWNLIGTVTFFYKAMPDWDTNNMDKLIWDALENVAYYDDKQLTDRHAHKRDINGSYDLKGVCPELAGAITDRQDFVYVRIVKRDPGDKSI